MRHCAYAMRFLHQNTRQFQRKYYICVVNVSVHQSVNNKTRQQSVVSIHGPLGYGPSTLPLRHSAYVLNISTQKRVNHGRVNIVVSGAEEGKQAFRWLSLCTFTGPRQYSGENPRLSRGRPRFNFPTGRLLDSSICKDCTSRQNSHNTVLAKIFQVEKKRAKPPATNSRYTVNAILIGLDVSKGYFGLLHKDGQVCSRNGNLTVLSGYHFISVGFVHGPKRLVLYSLDTHTQIGNNIPASRI